MHKKSISFLIGGFLLAALFTGCTSLSSNRPSSEPAGPEVYSAVAGYYYSLAVLERLEGNLAGAIDHMKRATAAQPESSYLTTELVALYVENNNVDVALSLGEAAVAKNPGNIELRSILGGVYFNSREYEKAVREYQNIIALEPKNVVAYLYLATIYGQEKKYSEAEQAYKKLLEIDPDNIIGLYYYAKTLMQMDRLAEAEHIYSKIITQRPAFEAAWMELAALYESQKKYDDAVRVYRRYLEVNPTRIHFRVKIAEMLMKSGREEDAVKEFRDILSIDPDNRDVLTALGLLYYDLKKYDQAAAEFSRLLEKNPGDDKLRYLLANALEQKGDLEAAKVEYQKVSPTFDLFSNAQIHTAMILKKEGKPAEAVAVMNRAVVRKSDDAVLYLYLSSLNEDLKDLPAAEKAALEGIRRFPRNADLYYVLGTIQEKTNRFDQSIKSMEKVLEIDPKNADAMNFIGYGYADRGIRLEEAEQMIVEALKIKPDNGYILDSLGWVHFKRNKIESALTHLKRALELLPGDANILEHLGDVYLKIGREQEALEQYRKALSLDPDNPALKKKLDLLIHKK